MIGQCVDVFFFSFFKVRRLKIFQNDQWWDADGRRIEI